MKNMKTFFAMAICLALVLTACPQDDDGGGNSATLTIKNESDFQITEVRWNNVFFIEEGKDHPMNSGMSATKDVPAESGQIRITTNQPDVGVLRIREMVTAEEGAKNQFVILNSTIVIDDNNKTGTLESIALGIQ